MKTLNPTERRVLMHLQNMSPEKPFYPYISRKLKQIPTPETVRTIISDLLSQGKDHPDSMRNILGFDIFSLMGKKIFTTDQVNKILQDAGYAWRVYNCVAFPGLEAKWLSCVGACTAIPGMVWVDSELNRYLRLGNGQIFACSSLDLQSMPERDKVNLRAELTGKTDRI